MLTKIKLLVMKNLKFFIIPLFLASSAFFLWILYLYRPDLDDQPEDLVLKFPTSLECVKNLFKLFALYKEKNFNYVLSLFACAYVFKQTFAIPGSIFLNLLAGALFGCLPYGLPLCCLLTAIGSSSCFLLSKFTAKEFVQSKFSGQIFWLEEKLSTKKNKGQMFLFLTGLRLFPASPNWLINVVSPYVNVPLPVFFLSVFAGLLPYNFLCLKTGETLLEVDSLDDIFTLERITFLVVMAATCIIFYIISKRRKIKFQ